MLDDGGDSYPFLFLFKGLPVHFPTLFAAVGVFLMPVGVTQGSSRICAGKYEAFARLVMLTFQ